MSGQASLYSVVPSSISIMSDTNKIYTTEDVESHKTSTSCWVSRGNKVYDVSNFLPDHPGGDDLILKYAGQDIDKAMKDLEEHDHSDSAYDMMEEYLIGRLGNQTATVATSASAFEFFIYCAFALMVWHRLGCT